MAAPALTANAWVHDFREGSRDMRRLLGGKGANVAEMTRILGPDLVPAGFTITTEARGAQESRHSRDSRVWPDLGRRATRASRLNPAGCSG